MRTESPAAVSIAPADGWYFVQPDGSGHRMSRVAFWRTEVRDGRQRTYGMLASAGEGEALNEPVMRNGHYVHRDDFTDSHVSLYNAMRLASVPSQPSIAARPALSLAPMAAAG